MLRRRLDEGGDFVPMFCNTGKERDETLDYLHEMETRWNVPLIWLEYTRVPATPAIALTYPHSRSQKTVLEQVANREKTHWFKVVSYETARRRDDSSTPFDELLSWANVLPNLRNRMCSVQMKVRTMMRFLFSEGIYAWRDHIGIRYDERDRALEIQANCPSYRTCRFPLIESKTTEADVLSFWREQPFDLKLDTMEGNCDLCFLKKKSKRVELVRRNPDSVIWWEAQEKRFAEKKSITGDGRYFRLNEPYSLIRTLAAMPVLPFPESEDQEIPCGCGDKGFVLSETINCEI